MKKKLKPGEKLPKGFTKRYILLLLCEAYPDSKDEWELIGQLKRSLGIKTPHGIRDNHLRPLAKEKLIFYDEENEEIRLNSKNFKEIIKKILEEDKYYNFFANRLKETKFISDFVNENLVKEIEKIWQIREEEKFLANRREIDGAHYRFSLEEVVTILKLSPTSLIKTLFPEEEMYPMTARNRLEQVLEKCLLKDLTSLSYYEKMVEIEAKIKVYNTKEINSIVEKVTLPVLKTKLEMKIVFPPIELLKRTTVNF